MKVVTDLKFLFGVAYNSREDNMIVSEWGSHRVSIFDNRGQKIRTFGTCGNSQGQMTRCMLYHCLC